MTHPEYSSATEDMVEAGAKAAAEAAGFCWENCAQDQWRRDMRAGLDAALSIGIAQQAVGCGVSWKDEDYKRARDCAIDILRNRGWTISPTRRDPDDFDEAFQHAVGILAMTASAVPSTDREAGK